MHSHNRHLFFFRTLIAVTIASFVVAFGPISAWAVGNDLMTVDLRTDLGPVYSATDYRTRVYASSMANVQNVFTNAWLGVYLHQYNGTTYSGEFSQVGMVANDLGLTWFVYAEPGVTCLRGHPSYGTLGCTGDPGDLGFSVGTWHQVELVTYGEGYWIARVWNSSGTTSTDVARINYSSLRIYRATDTSEEGYDGTMDPQLNMNFLHWHPQYNDFVYGWTDWPGSTGGNDNIYHVTPSTACPGIYGANLDLSGDPYYWQIASGAQTCYMDPIF